MTTQDKRTQLIGMTHGRGCNRVEVFPLGYMAVAHSLDAGTAYGEAVQGCVVLPCEHNAVQSICAAVAKRERARRGNTTPTPEDAAQRTPRNTDTICTPLWYDDRAADADVLEAMATHPCLANYGGTLRAVNVDAAAAVVIILKDMATI